VKLSSNVLIITLLSINLFSCSSYKDPQYPSFWSSGLPYKVSLMEEDGRIVLDLATREMISTGDHKLNLHKKEVPGGFEVEIKGVSISERGTSNALAPAHGKVELPVKKRALNKFKVIFKHNKSTDIYKLIVTDEGYSFRPVGPPKLIEYVQPEFWPIQGFTIGETVKFLDVERGSYSRYNSAEMKIIKNQRSWEMFWRSHRGRNFWKILTPRINFNEEIVIALIGEEHAYYGHTLEVTEIKNGSPIIVYYKKTDPNTNYHFDLIRPLEGSGRPSHIVKIKSTKKKIIFKNEKNKGCKNKK